MHNNQSSLNSAIVTYTRRCKLRFTAKTSGADPMQNCPDVLVVGSGTSRANQHAYALYIEDLQTIRGQVLRTHTHDNEYCKKYLQEVSNGMLL
jgi:hypothetical protein